MEKYEFPTNIKQVGDIDNNLRIYMEDFVYSYLLQYAKSKGNNESIAGLVGRCMIIDGQKVLFISGAIQGLYAESKKGILTFTNESMEYMEEQRLKHFKGLEIVGWMLSQPGYGNYLSSGHINYHINNFKKPYQVMFVLDTVEKVNTFFQYNSDEAEIEEMNGFFIYYDKNKDMQDYMMENKIETTEEEEKEEEKKVEKEEVKTFDMSDGRDNRESDSKINIINIDKTKKIKKDSHIIKRGKELISNSSVLAGGMAAAVIVTMGVSLVQSDSKIAKLENDINVLADAYNLLVTHVNNTDNVATVFASSDEQLANYEEDNTYVEVEDVTNIEEYTDYEEEKEEIENEELEEANAEYIDYYEADNVYEEVDIEEEYTEEIEDVEEEYEEDTEEVEDAFVMSKKPDYYIVQQGDSLSSISRTVYGTDDMQKQIMAANNIEDPNKIYFGMKLLLP